MKFILLARALVAALTLALLTACMGPPSTDASGFNGRNPASPPAPSTPQANPIGTVISSGSGVSTGTTTKMRARVGNPFQNQTAGSATMQIRTSIQRDTYDAGSL